jgi:hypothetical protein
MPIRKPAAKKAPARQAAPARKTTPAKKTAPAKKAAPAPTPAQVPPTQAHDVLRAEVAWVRAQQLADIAKAEHEAIRAAYWDQYDDVIEGAADHAKKIAEIASLAPDYKSGRQSLKEGPARKVRSRKPVIDEYFDREDTANLPLRELRELAADLVEKGAITEATKKAVILEQMEAAGLFREDGLSSSDEDDVLDDEEDEERDEEESDDDDDEYDDESDEDDDDGDGEEGYTLAELKAMSLKELQDIAENNGVSWKGLKQNALIEALQNAEPDDEDDEEEDEEDEEELELSEEDIEAMDISELIELLTRMGVTSIPAKAKKNHDALVALVLENLTEDDDEEEDDEEE